MSAYYNEFDPKAAATLRELITEGLIAPGDVDERSVEDVLPSEIAGYTQVHLFAGFGIWSLAFRMAGWPDSRPVWSASFPCQPFSAAGKGGGFDDERHLWPAGFWLLQHGKGAGVPIYGEQVASPDGLSWLDLVRADLETIDHSVWSVVLASAGFGAPIIRQRSYWLARAGGAGWDAGRAGQESDGRYAPRQQPGRLRDARGVGDTESDGLRTLDGESDASLRREVPAGGSGIPRGMECPASIGRDERWPQSGERSVAARRGALRLGEPNRTRLERRGGNSQCADQRAPGESGVDGGLGSPRNDGRDRAQTTSPVADGDGSDGGISLGASDRVGRWPGPTNGFWRTADWLRCRDDKWRPVEPGTFPLAHGYPERMGILRGAGNAISPQVAAAWISVTM